MSKARLNISLDPDLVEFVKVFASENRTTVADVFTQYILSLKRRTQGDPTEMILSNPAFREAMEDTQKRLRDGSAEWHSMDEVFGD